MVNRHLRNGESPITAFSNFKAKVAGLTSAAKELLEAWERLEGVDPDLAVEVSVNYPFHSDFGELYGDIQGWKTALQNIRK